MQENKTKPWEFFSPLKLNHPKDILAITKSGQWENSIGFPFPLRGERSYFFFLGDEKRLNKSSKKGKPQLICKCKGVWKGFLGLAEA